jgi:hypothetical protein
MWLAFRSHYPYVALTLIGVPVLLADPALFIMGFALAIGLVPCACAPDVDEIAGRTHDSGST